MMALILATDGFEDSEFSYPYYRLREAGVDVEIATPDGTPIEGKHGYEFEADLAIDAYDPDRFADDFDLLVLPGGRSPEQLRIEAPSAADIVATFDERERPIASICHGSQLLISADVVEGRQLTGYWTLKVDIENAGGEFLDESVVVDGNLVTSRYPDDLPAFMDEFLELVDQEHTIPA